jgi:phosphotransferase system IIB component
MVLLLVSDCENGEHKYEIYILIENKNLQVVFGTNPENGVKKEFYPERISQREMP